MAPKWRPKTERWSAVADPQEEEESEADDHETQGFNTTEAGDSTYTIGRDVDEPPGPAPHARAERVTTPVTPPQLRDPTVDVWEWKNINPRVGNVGWFCGNWGALPKNRDMNERVRAGMKKGPAQIVALCEAEAEVEDWLRRPAVAEWCWTLLHTTHGRTKTAI